MALIVSAASGNFNAGATWVGGVVPGVGDEAQAANGHTITITANVTCDEVSNAGSGFFEINPNVTLTANVTSKSTNTANRVVRFNFAAPNTANIVGIVTGGIGTNQTFAVQNSSTGTLNVTGDCIGGSGTNTIAAANSSTGVLNLTGSCTGNSVPAASNSSTGVLNITGNCIGGTSASAFGANNASTGTMLINGVIQASEFAAGVGGTNRQQVTLLTGPFLISPTFGVNPIACTAWRWASALNNQTYLEVGTQTLLQKRNLVTPDNATNFPAASNVRSGITYGIGGVVTGTCVVPNPAQVAAGTPVDNTVGTLASPSASDIATAVWGAASRTITGGTVDTLTNAPASVTPTDIWSHATRTLTSASGPTAVQIRQEIDTNSTQLSAIKAKTDALPSDPADQSLLEAAIAGVTAPSASTVATAVRSELSSELAKVSALNTDRLAQCSTVATTGAQIAAALS